MTKRLSRKSDPDRVRERVAPPPVPFPPRPAPATTEKAGDMLPPIPGDVEKKKKTRKRAPRRKA